jgi:hypothetical protein
MSSKQKTDHPWKKPFSARRTKAVKMERELIHAYSKSPPTSLNNPRHKITSKKPDEA